MKLGQLYENRVGRPDLAYHAYSEAQALSEDSLDAIFGMYRVLMQRGDRSAQSEHLERCRAIVAELPQEAQERFDAHLAELGLGDAPVLDRGGSKDDPLHAIALYRSGLNAERVGHFADAVDDYADCSLGPASLWGALRSARRLGDAQKVVEVGNALARACSAPLERAMLFSELGRSLEFELKAPMLHLRCMRVRSNFILGLWVGMRLALSLLLPTIFELRSILRLRGDGRRAV